MGTNRYKSDANLSYSSLERVNGQRTQDSIKNFACAKDRGQSEYPAEVCPMRGSQLGPSPIHSSGVARAYVRGLHDSFIPHSNELVADEEATDEMAAIANECIAIVNTNMPTEGMPVGTNGAQLNLTVHANSNGSRGGVWNNSAMSHLRAEGPAGVPNMNGPSGVGAGKFNMANYNWGSSGNGAGGNLGETGRKGKHIIPANRQIGDITHIVLHVTQGSDRDGAAQSTINWFARGPTGPFRWTNSQTNQTVTGPPCDEVVRVDGMLSDKMVCNNGVVEKAVKTSIHWATDRAGNVVQGGEEKDIAQHAGGTYNRKSIGIEMCGRSQDGPGEGAGGLYSKMYTEAHLEAVAKLCAEICKRWQIRPSVETIIGHEKIAPHSKIGPGENIGKTEFGKKYGADSGNYWNWDDFMGRVNKYYKGGTV